MRNCFFCDYAHCSQAGIDGMYGDGCAMDGEEEERKEMKPMLKPCPFCGQEVEVQDWTRGGNAGELPGLDITWGVACENPDCPCNPATDDGYRSAEEAAAAWNRRAGEAVMRAKILKVAAGIRELVSTTMAKERGVSSDEVRNIAAQLETIADEGGAQ